MGQEAEQRGRFLPLEGEGLPEQFVDRIARLAPQSAIEFAPPVERPRQQRIEEAKRRGEIGHAEPSAQRRHRLDRKSVVEGKSVSVRVDLGGRSILKKKKQAREKPQVLLYMKGMSIGNLT